MAIFGRTVQMHKNRVRRLISDSERTLTIKLPVPTQSSGVNPLFGNLNRETDVSGEEKGPYNCLWYDAYSARSIGVTNTGGIEKVVESTPGQFRDATAFAEVWLQDVLIDSNNPDGQTWFDKALHVVCQGKKYKVLGYVKLGLAVSAPYSAVVGLKGGLGYDNP
jgi:hypothetical protein